MNPTIYHGSDMRIISQTPEARAEYKNACLKAAEYLWQYFEPYYNHYYPDGSSKLNDLKKLIPNDKFPNLYSNLVDKLTCFSAYLNKSPLYQYDEEITYFSSCKNGAARYAWSSFAGGEMGLIVYRMLEACRAMNIEYVTTDPEITAAIATVEQFSTGVEQPVIIPVSDYDKDKLFLEDGREMDDFFFNLLLDEENSRFSMKYCGKLEFDLSKAIFLKV